MRYLTLFVSLVAFALTGCSQRPDNRPFAGVALGIATPRMDLSAIRPPQHLGTFTLQGNISNGNSQTHMYRYIGADARTMDITVYPWPGGWEEMDPERRVTGHFGQVRQALGEYMMKRGAKAVQADNQQIHLDPSSNSYVASATLLDQDGKLPAILLMLSSRQQLFIQLTLQPARDAHDAELAQQLLNDFSPCLSAGKANAQDSK